MYKIFEASFIVSHYKFPSPPQPLHILFEMDGIWMDKSQSNMQIHADYLAVLPHEGQDVVVVTNMFQR